MLRWIAAYHYLLITNDRASMPVHLAAHLMAGEHVPGVIQLPRSATWEEIAADLLLIWGAGDPDEFRDRITSLPLR